MFRRLLSALLLVSVLPGAASAQKVTSGFGYRNDPMGRGVRHHSGMDIAARSGTPVYATGDGWVTYAGWLGAYGNLIKLQHPSGYETRFGHLSRIAIMQNQWVRKGQLIGYIGSTGRSTGPHLHYEVRMNGVALNPRGFM